jgi:hypothetical protein
MCGNFLRPALLERPCFHRHAAVARIVHLGPPGRHPVQSQSIGKRPRSELQKELLPLRHRTNTCAFPSTFPILQLLYTGEVSCHFTSASSRDANHGASPMDGRKIVGRRSNRTLHNSSAATSIVPKRYKHTALGRCSRLVLWLEVRLALLTLYLT